MGVVVAWNFITRRIQPGKERAHPGYEFAGDIDTTREVPKKITRKAAMSRLADLFNLVIRADIADPQQSFSLAAHHRR